MVLSDDLSVGKYLEADTLIALQGYVTWLQPLILILTQEWCTTGRIWSNSCEGFGSAIFK